MPDAPLTTGELAQRIGALEADPAFRTLCRAQMRTNLFRVVGKTDAERWHAAFWSWILDPSGSHGLGDFAVRQLLLRSLDSDGTLPVVRLVPNAQSGHWVPSTTQPRISAADLLSLEIRESVVAPGPRSGFREVCPLVDAPPGLNKDGDTGRFDILMALDGESQRGPTTLIIVIEVKVNHRYRHQQLEMYSSWLHRDPAAERLRAGTTAAADFVQAYSSLLEQTASRGDAPELWTLGLFLSRAVPPAPHAPRDLALPWQALRYEDLVGAILEPILTDPELDEAARPLVQSYLDVAFAEELSTMPTQEHRELVRALVDRNRETFKIIARVLADSEDKAIRESGELLVDEGEAERSASLVPKLLLDNQFVCIGDEIEHTARTPRGAAQPLFTGKLVARVVSGDRAGFEFVSGAGLTPDQVPGRHTATGLLKTVYKHFNYPFPRNGNDCWRFTTGPFTGKTLADAYDDVREQDVDAQESVPA